MLGLSIYIINAIRLVSAVLLLSSRNKYYWKFLWCIPYQMPQHLFSQSTKLALTALTITLLFWGKSFGITTACSDYYHKWNQSFQGGQTSCSGCENAWKTLFWATLFNIIYTGFNRLQIVFVSNVSHSSSVPVQLWFLLYSIRTQLSITCFFIIAVTLHHVIC